MSLVEWAGRLRPEGGAMESPYLYWAAAIAVAAVLMVLLFSTYDGGLVGG